MLKEYRKAISNARELIQLDELLVDALFKPAEEAGVFDLIGTPWRDPDNRHNADSLIDQLLRLSEFYQGSNPPLSAALWDIWNTVRYLRNERPLLSALIESDKKNLQVFMGVKGLIATAAIQFSDGNASTVTTSNAMSSLDKYKEYVEETIQNLSAYRENEP